MTWRSMRLSSLHAVLHPPLGVYGLTCRTLSTSSADPNIATLIKTPPKDSRELITAKGWVRTVRKQKRMTFVEIGDGSTPETLQAVLNPLQAEGLSTGTAVAIQGTWQSAPPGAKQVHELEAKEVVIHGLADNTYPIQKKYHSLEYLRTIPHLRLRTPLNAVLARMRSEVDYHASQFFRHHAFVRLQPPMITSSDCEGAGEVFDVSSQSISSAAGKSDMSQANRSHFFRSLKHLTVSSQLHLEAYVHEHPKVWALAPTFRAEKSDTPRHVSEFWMLEVEMRTESLHEVMDLAEDMIRAVVTGLERYSILEDIMSTKTKAVDASKQGDHASLPDRWATLQGSQWPRVRYVEAIEQLRAAANDGKARFTYRPDAHQGLQLEHERWIADNIGRGQPTFVTHYPADLKPFYMLPSTMTAASGDEMPTVECFDLLFPEMCEAIGGSLREFRLEALASRMEAHGLSSSTTDWYLDLRRYGSVPHGGFGLGLDRLLGYLSGVDNIKDVVQWPRYYGRCEC